MRRVGLLRKLLRGNVPVPPVVKSAFIQYGEKPVRKTKANPKGDPCLDIGPTPMILPSYDEFIETYVRAKHAGIRPPLYAMQDIARRVQDGGSPKRAFVDWAEWFNSLPNSEEDTEESNSRIIQTAYDFVRALGNYVDRRPYPRQKDLWAALGIEEATPVEDPSNEAPITLSAVHRALAAMDQYDPNR
jgi:hypothetical protein